MRKDDHDPKGYLRGPCGRDRAGPPNHGKQDGRIFQGKKFMDAEQRRAVMDSDLDFSVSADWM